MPVPNFLVIGDIKAGSSSLNAYLKQHPQVYVPTAMKELRYFAYDSENPYHVQARSARVRSYEEYLEHFRNADGCKAIGESSPSYFRSPLAAGRIQARFPDIKLIVSLRNPAERLYSLYLMGFRNGNIRKSFAEQVFGQDALWIKGNALWPDLKRYFDLFDPQQIKVILFDDLKVDTEHTVKDLYAFLDIDAGFVPDLSVRNKGGMPKNRHWYAFMMKSRKLLGHALSPPPALKRIWMNTKAASLQDSKIDPLLRRKILEICVDDIRRTESLIQRDLSRWLA